MGGETAKMWCECPVRELNVCGHPDGNCIDADEEFFIRKAGRTREYNVCRECAEGVIADSCNFTLVALGEARLD